MKMKYFSGVDCIEELKAQYRKLAMKFHPDRGGSNQAMQEINAEYSALFEKYKNIHAGKNSETGKRETYTAKEETKECPADFIEIVSALLGMDGLTVELCGRWLWIGGETMKHKENLKKIGCKWSSTKKLWSWHFPEESASPFKRKSWNMEKIRSTFGSEDYTGTAAKEEHKKNPAMRPAIA